jgi:hypothetical protein
MDGILPERLGNLHLVLLHLPIGFVVAAVLLELWRARRPSVEGAWLQGRLLAANAVAALLTAGAGLVLAEQGTYPAETLAWHRWAGVTCAGLAIATWAAHAGGRVWVARGALGALLAATVMAGHQGATLTHGEAATAWWGGASEAGSARVEMTGGSDAVFIKSIQPILTNSCLECHGAVRPKGRLRLDSREGALASGRSGRVAVVPGRPEASELLRRVKLPRDDEEAMPEGDGSGLSAEQIAALEKWIADGARW